ncbi:uncharacterized protein N7511_008598 [Penicillium nucicola]|uniref:uncharacterized protein n=1 Tax=Penicillium nucicola TaxID=1850975 RepID=UPI00254522FE|nr:uncharacterized protein N7511_008598 [Penicillium nucicola]KAJ5746902.1 hypothetical protein N7511_008598 [Penicillium nucicola]
MWDYFDGKSILVTGGSRFLGTAVVHRLLSRSSTCHVYLLCRGGEEYVETSPGFRDRTANAHLHAPSKVTGSDLDVQEDFYCLKTQGNPIDEWNDVKKLGTSQAYESEDFPWAYAYAKHLTERLLLHRFCQSDAKEKLLIVRPSIVGPAQRFPFPGYNMRFSSPSTVLATIMALEPYRRWNLVTQFEAPELQAQIDEVPVDVVVDRLLSHLAAGNDGCIHAGDWKSGEQHWASRLYVILGTSFAFSEDRTMALSREVDQKKFPDLQLFTRINMASPSVIREEHIRHVMETFAQKFWGAWLILNVFYRNFGFKT